MDKNNFSISDWIDISHDIAKEHGWWDKERNDGECLMLITCELAECMEVVRRKDCGGEIKKEMIAEELADVAIRLFDYCGGRGIDLEKAIEIKTIKNRQRAYKHGKEC